MNERVSSTSVSAPSDLAPPSQVLKAFVNRQPIYDAQRHLYAYTLRHQSAPRLQEHDEQHPNTPVLICYAFMETGLDALVGSHRAVFHLTRGLRLMEDVLTSLPIDSDVQNALLYHEGALGRILCSVLAYEHGHWDDVPNLGINSSIITDSYLRAIVWAEAYKEFQ